MWVAYTFELLRSGFYTVFDKAKHAVYIQLPRWWTKIVAFLNFFRGTPTKTADPNVAQFHAPRSSNQDGGPQLHMSSRMESYTRAPTKMAVSCTRAPTKTADPNALRNPTRCPFISNGGPLPTFQRVIFQNTNVQQLKIHPRSNYMRLKERLENKLQQQITDIYYRYPCFNDGVNNVTYTTTKIEDDNDVGLMFQCHSTYNLSDVIKLYVCLVDSDEGDQVTYLTQTSQSHQYQMSQETILSLTQVPETILSLTPVPDEDVGDDSDYEEARYVETQNQWRK
ncbi:hypothetical protein KIW84_051420 [Lathyrus oleraceus]|uniref:Uncharacterized protein n=1 Tax=Pisum sativum TaxID=3888 RepID=A0A9D4WL30_PEA|nr:hypothetical protein KIW84_051420 [Pisum sativum]